VRSLAPTRAAQSASVARSAGARSTAFAQGAQAFVAAFAWRQRHAHADLGRAQQLVAQQRLDQLLAPQQLGPGRRGNLAELGVRAGVQAQHQGAHQLAHLDHHAGLPGRAGGAAGGSRYSVCRSASSTTLIEWLTPAGTQTAREGGDEGAVVGAEPAQAVEREGELGPFVVVRHHLGLGLQVAHLGAQRARRRGQIPMRREAVDHAAAAFGPQRLACPGCVFGRAHGGCRAGLSEIRWIMSFHRQPDERVDP
jgi:hypothetical protein